MKRQDELNEAWCKYMGKCSTEIMQALAFALRWTDAHPRWISVEDELPPIGGIVLVAIPLGGELSVLPLSIKNESDFECLSGMTHWMPMPQPPLVTDLNKKDLPPVSCQEGDILVTEEGGEE